jgi:O-antigen ligase
MGIFSALLATGFVAFLAVSTTHRPGVGGLLLLGFICIAVALCLWVGIQPVIERFAAPDLFATRTGMWADTLALIRKSPVLGIGLGSLGVAITQVQTVYLSLLIDHAHNDYLEFIAELGLPGALLLFASVFWIFCRDIQALYRRGRNLPKALALGSAGSLIDIFSHSLTDFNLHIPANALVFTVVLGLAYNVSTASAATARPGTD